MTETTEEQKKGKKLKIILIDDDSFLLDMYTLKFKKDDFEVYGFTDTDMAIEKLREGFVPDIIIFDLVMAGVDGWTFAKEIREKKLAPESKLIVLSNQEQRSDIDKLEDFDISGFIVKAQATPTQVVEKVKEIYEESNK